MRFEFNDARDSIAAAHADIKSLKHFEKDLSHVNHEISKQINEHEIVLAATKQSFEDCKIRVDQYHDNMREMSNQIVETQAYIDFINQYGRREILEFHGLLPKLLGTGKRMKELSEENTTALIIDFLYETLNISCTKYDISTSHRLHYKSPQNMNTKVPPIYVKFVNRDLKDHILHLKKNNIHRLRNPDGSKVFICENLTPYRRKLLQEAKERLPSFRFIWSKDGKILLRKYKKSKIIHLKDFNMLKTIVDSCKLPFKPVVKDSVKQNKLSADNHIIDLKSRFDI